MSLSISLCLSLYVVPRLVGLISEQNIEREVLHSQCRKLEAQHYNLSLTAEQVSHSMGVSVSHTLTHLFQLFSSGLSCREFCSDAAMQNLFSCSLNP